jgi:hypothetical protein
MADRVLHGGMRQRTRRYLAAGLGAACMLGLGTARAETPVHPPQALAPTATPQQMQAVTDAALAAAVKRSGLDKSEVKVITAEPVTWSDGSLGCAQDGLNYTQALVRGFRVRIKAGESWLEYHAGADGKVFYCPTERVLPPVPDDGI